jgi:hypothetical protein
VLLIPISVLLPAVTSTASGTRGCKVVGMSAGNIQANRDCIYCDFTKSLVMVIVIVMPLGQGRQWWSVQPVTVLLDIYIRPSHVK